MKTPLSESTVILSRQMTDAYIECALWSSTDDDGGPLDQSDAELADDTRETMARECSEFLAYCDAEGIDRSDWDDSQLGHDLWLTRNGHGAGFWDRGFPAGQALTAAAKTFGSADLYIGDDGLIYQS